MKGFIRKSVLGSCLGGAFLALAGCAEYRELVDPCWPERYNHQARNSVNEAFNAQAANGHALDQVIWNQHFEVSSAKLTKVGEEHLKYLARRRPAPDPRVMVQVAYDAKGNAKELNDRRVEVVQEYLSKVAANERCVPGGCCGPQVPVTFEVTLCDASEPGLPMRSAPNVYVTPTRVIEDRQLLRETTPGNGPVAGATSTSTTGTAPTQGQSLQQR